MSDIISIVIGLVGLLVIAALAKREAAGWLNGNSWGGQPLPVVVETRPRRYYQPVWSIEEVCSRNLKAGCLVWGW